MFQLDYKSRLSIYEQIINGFKEMIVSGEMSPGDKMPSVRELSTRLTVNPNTIQKAYSALEVQQWIYTVSGRGSYVSDTVHKADRTELDKLMAKTAKIIDEMLYLGADPEEVTKEITDLIRERRMAR